MKQNELIGLSSYCAEVCDPILKGEAYKVTKIIDDHLTMKATRKRFSGKIRKNDKLCEIVLTTGRPNYQEREYIKKHKKAGIPYAGELIIKK